MSLKDLEDAGITLPRDHWGKHTVRSAVNRPAFLLCASVAIAGTGLMYVGEGRLTTWIGALMFLASLILATAISFLAVASEQKPHARPDGRPAKQDQ